MNKLTKRKGQLENVVNVLDLIPIGHLQYGIANKKSKNDRFWKLVYLHAGVWEIRVEKEPISLSKGEGILLPPDSYFELHGEKGAMPGVFFISFTEERGLLLPLGGRVLHFDESMQEIMKRIIRECTKTYILPVSDANHRTRCRKDSAYFGGEQIIKMQLEELLILLYRKEILKYSKASEKARLDDGIATQIMHLLEDNLYNSLTISDITQTIGYGKTYLSCLFKRVYGKSIMECYMQMKMDESKRLLQEGKLSVTEISDRLCFSSVQYFSKWFSRAANMSPSQYAGFIREKATPVPE